MTPNEKREAMNIRDVATNYLENCGLFPDQAAAVMSVAETDDKCALHGRWNDAIDGYPASFRALIQLTIRAYALAWIDEHMPKHFAQYMFDPKRMEASTP